jgi:hypothetical protein
MRRARTVYGALLIALTLAVLGSVACRERRTIRRIDIEPPQEGTVEPTAGEAPSGQAELPPEGLAEDSDDGGDGARAEPGREH